MASTYTTKKIINKTLSGVYSVQLRGGRAHIDNSCRGCGRCVDICPNQASDLAFTDHTFVSRTFDRLTTAVDST